MSEFFLQVINMSISASYIVLAVLLLRPLLRRAPKWINGILWGIVAVRLICPFSVESILSLIPSAEVVSPDIMMDQTPSINSGIPIVNEVVNPMIGSSFAPDPATSANPLQLWIPMLALIWLVGVLALLAYMAVSYLRLSRRVADAVRLRENIYRSESIASPFVLGLIKPRIYLPLGLSERDTEHVLAHEQAHVRRRDYLWKPLGFLLLALHWFNPLMWLGYVLLCRDIELACDEKVIRSLGRDARADYSQALLGCSVKRHTITACPLAFGEVGVKTRVKSVLHYKKPAFWIIVAALVICIAVAVCFLTNPKNERQDDGDTPPSADGPRYGETDPARLNEVQRELLEKYPHFFGLDAAKGLNVYVCQFAPTNYNFSLAPHSEDETVDSVEESIELVKLGSVRPAEMREILATYEISRDDVTIVPWQAMHSSYIAPYFIYPIRPSDEKELIQQRYIDGIMEMLFGENNSEVEWSAEVKTFWDALLAGKIAMPEKVTVTDWSTLSSQSPQDKSITNAEQIAAIFDTIKASNVNLTRPVTATVIYSSDQSKYIRWDTEDGSFGFFVGGAPVMIPDFGFVMLKLQKGENSYATTFELTGEQCTALMQALNTAAGRR